MASLLRDEFEIEFLREAAEYQRRAQSFLEASTDFGRLTAGLEAFGYAGADWLLEAMEEASLAEVLERLRLVVQARGDEAKLNALVEAGS